jgi:hypothetical protein
MRLKVISPLKPKLSTGTDFPGHVAASGRACEAPEWARRDGGTIPRGSRRLQPKERAGAEIQRSRTRCRIMVDGVIGRYIAGKLSERSRHVVRAYGVRMGWFFGSPRRLYVEKHLVGSFAFA